MADPPYGPSTDALEGPERAPTTVERQARLSDLPITLEHWNVVESATVDLDGSPMPGVSLTYRSDVAACELSVRAVREKLSGEREYNVTVKHFDADSAQPAGDGSGLTFFGESLREQFHHVSDDIRSDVKTFLRLNSF